MTDRYARSSSQVWRWAAAALLAVTALLLPPVVSAASAAGVVEVDDGLWIGARQGYAGTGVFPVYTHVPADPGNPGDPDYWAYCIEHDVTAQSGLSGEMDDPAGYLGANHFTDPLIRAKVQWILAHSYPAVGLTELGAAAGAVGISRNDAIEATQYAIWAFTELTGTPAWAWESTDSEAAYYYLMAGAHASSGATPDTAAVAVQAPAASQVGGTLIGPFVVSTNRPVAEVTASPALPVTDAAGTPVDASAVVDGQQFYLDARGTGAAGAATVSATVTGASANGMIVSVPTVDGQTPTAADHAQSIILVAASGATTTAGADVTWSAATPAVQPTIGTTLLDDADGDHELAWDGGALTDTVRYRDLVPGTSYTITGTLVRRPGGSPTGITASTTFTPTSPDGTVEVHLTVPRGHAGEVLVAFETLVESGSTAVVAEHKDIDDAGQRVTVQTRVRSTSSPTPTGTRTPTTTHRPAPGTTPSSAATSTPSDVPHLAQTGAEATGWSLALALAGILAGSALLVVRRRLRG